ncbi:MAG: HAD family hydrolase [Promethearchaeota archaeon]
MEKPILLFDFDGVIITQKALEYTALKLLKKKFFGWRNVRELRLIDFARFFEESDSSNRIKAIIQAYKTYKRYIPIGWKRIIFFFLYKRTYPKLEHYETLREGLEKILEALKKKGVIMGIVSNTSKKRLEYFREKLKLDRFFSVYISRDDSPFRKPDPTPIYLALKEIKKKFKCKINKSLVFLVGDLKSDIEAAKNANIKSIAFLSGHGLSEDLKFANPSITINNFSDILKIDPFRTN